MLECLKGMGVDISWELELQVDQREGVGDSAQEALTQAWRS